MKLWAAACALGFAAWVGLWAITAGARLRPDNTGYGDSRHEAWVGAQWGFAIGLVIALLVAAVVVGIEAASRWGKK